MERHRRGAEAHGGDPEEAARYQPKQAVGSVHPSNNARNGRPVFISDMSILEQVHDRGQRLVRRRGRLPEDLPVSTQSVPRHLRWVTPAEHTRAFLASV